MNFSTDCADKTCSAHYRVDEVTRGIAGGTLYVGYAGNYVVMTDETVRQDIDEVTAMNVAMEAFALKLSGAPMEEIKEKTSTILGGETLVFEVGPEGVANDITPGTQPVETFHGEVVDNLARHEMVLDLFRLKSGTDNL